VNNLIEKIVRLLLISFLLVGYEVDAQQLPLYSQHVMNKYLINPAVAGSGGYTQINLTAREQWIGIKDSPKTHALSIHSRILRNSFISKTFAIRRNQKSSLRDGRVGLGAYIFNDRSGLISRTGFQFTYAYHINIQEGQLSFGLSGNIYQFKLDQQEMRSYEPDDATLNYARGTTLIPDADFGVYFANQSMYVGFSTAYLFQSAFKFGNQGYKNFRLKRHHYLVGGYNHELNSNIRIEPNLMMKLSESPRFQMDLGTNIYFYENYWGGLAYRTGGALIIMGGVKVDKFYFGYAFDYTFINLMRHSFGSHEFMLAMKLGENARRYRWLKSY